MIDLQSRVAGSKCRGLREQVCWPAKAGIVRSAGTSSGELVRQVLGATRNLAYRRDVFGLLHLVGIKRLQFDFLLPCSAEPRSVGHALSSCGHQYPRDVPMCPPFPSASLPADLSLERKMCLLPRLRHKGAAFPD